jgi:hypothetical protein
VRTSPEQPGTGLGLVSLGKLHSDNTTIAPGDAAWADLGIKKHEAAVCHDGPL